MQRVQDVERGQLRKVREIAITRTSSLKACRSTTGSSPRWKASRGSWNLIAYTWASVPSSSARASRWIVSRPANADSSRVGRPNVRACPADDPDSPVRGLPGRCSRGEAACRVRRAAPSGVGLQQRADQIDTLQQGPHCVCLEIQCLTADLVSVLLRGDARELGDAQEPDSRGRTFDGMDEARVHRLRVVGWRSRLRSPASSSWMSVIASSTNPARICARTAPGSPDRGSGSGQRAGSTTLGCLTGIRVSLPSRADRSRTASRSSRWRWWPGPPSACRCSIPLSASGSG